MSARVAVDAALARLRELAAGDAPDEQQAYARALLTQPAARDGRVLRAALLALAGTTDPAARPALLVVYARLDGDGGRRDPGAELRGTTLRALREITHPDDAALLERAVLTYEFLPPGPSEVASGLRATALVALNELDPALAGFHCARLLRDPLTSRMSGEPGLTAVDVLAAQEQWLPLYTYALDPPAPPLGAIPEITAQCLLALTALPDALLSELIERFHEHPQDVVLAALYELLLRHPAADDYRERLHAFLSETRRYDVFRYLVNLSVAERREALIAELVVLATGERDALRKQILDDALALR